MRKTKVKGTTKVTGITKGMMKSIRTKIMFFAGLLILLVLLCQIIFNVYLSKPYFINYKKTEIEKLFYDIKNQYSDDYNIISEVITDAEDTLNLKVIIYNEHGMIYNSRGNNALDFYKGVLKERDVNNSMKEFTLNISLFSENPTAELVEGNGNIPGMFNTFKNIDEGQIIIKGKFQYEGQWRYILIESPVESIVDSVNILTQVNIFISFIILIVGGIGSLVFSKKISKPIQNIDDVAKNVANLNFDVKAEEHLSTTELNSLSKNINTMSDKLKDLITDLQSANDKLQQDIDYQVKIDKMRREFVANVSHELKTPLCLLMMYSEGLKNNMDKVDKDYYCDTIIEESKKMNDMVKSMLDIASIENGLSKLNMEVFDFSGFTKFVLSKTKVMFIDKGIDLSLNIDPEVNVCGDKHYLEQAMKNYITNAISHTQSQGKIEIYLKGYEDSVRFSVINYGEAINEQDIHRIWESFYKTDKARVRDEENHVGLGLYIVKTIIQSHQGEYGASNIHGGVEFWFSIPICK